MKFKIQKGDSTCNECGSDGVAIADFEEMNGMTGWYCEYCANAVGKPYDGVTKIQLVHMMHTLEKRLKNKP